MQIKNDIKFTISDEYLGDHKIILNTIGKGDYVKICWGSKLGIGFNEKFWVEVLYINNDIILGRVSNELLKSDIHNLYENDLITFTLDKIFDIDFYARK